MSDVFREKFMTAQTETRTIAVERCPPKRLFQSGRFRTFKTSEARSWNGTVAALRVAALDGWRLARVSIEFGGSRPLAPDPRERMARELTLCHDGCELVMTCGQPGRGRTVWELER